MILPIQLISTDFDGTLFSEHEDPPNPQEVADTPTRFAGARCEVGHHTGRDMSSLMEALPMPCILPRPDYLVLVEREIHVRDGLQYQSLEPWNSQCASDHAELFARSSRTCHVWQNGSTCAFAPRSIKTTIHPFCLIAGNHRDADVIHDYLIQYCLTVPKLTVVRNDVYARFSHEAYDKGTALAEITRHLGLSRAQVFAAGDHFNDLPMLSSKHASWLAAPQMRWRQSRRRCETKRPCQRSVSWQRRRPFAGISSQQGRSALIRRCFSFDGSRRLSHARFLVAGVDGQRRLNDLRRINPVYVFD